MKLIVLGIYAPYPPVGCATSGYILSCGESLGSPKTEGFRGDTNILLDCGSGVIARAQEFMHIDDLSAVVLSHLHGDHMADMMELRYMQGYRKRFGLGAKESMTIYAPGEPEMEYEYLRSVKFFDVRPVSHGMKARAGKVNLQFFKMEHPYPVFGVRAEYKGKVFAYSGDTVMNENITPMIKDADVFLCDSSFLEADKVPESTHLSAAEAARLSRDNGVKQLILTHRLTHYGDYSRHLAEAQAIFKNSALAEEREVYEF